MKRDFTAFSGGAITGDLCGLIGLGGAEFRLPLLIGVFLFVALEAVILNKAMSLVVVTSALPSRAMSIPFSDVLTPHPTRLPNPKPTTVNKPDSRYDRGTTGGQVSKRTRSILISFSQSC